MALMDFLNQLPMQTLGAQQRPMGHGYPQMGGLAGMLNNYPRMGGNMWNGWGGRQQPTYGAQPGVPMPNTLPGSLPSGGNPNPPFNPQRYL